MQFDRAAPTTFRSRRTAGGPNTCRWHSSEARSRPADARSQRLDVEPQPCEQTANKATCSRLVSQRRDRPAEQMQPLDKHPAILDLPNVAVRPNVSPKKCDIVADLDPAEAEDIPGDPGDAEDEPERPDLANLENHYVRLIFYSTNLQVIERT